MILDFCSLIVRNMKHGASISDSKQHQLSIALQTPVKYWSFSRHPDHLKIILFLHLIKAVLDQWTMLVKIGKFPQQNIPRCAHTRFDGNFVINSAREYKEKVWMIIKLTYWNINRWVTSKNAILQYSHERQSVLKL